MQDVPDQELLRQYARENSEAAFAALVARHVNLVYSAALRKTGNPDAAEEITQAVFVILAKKAEQLTVHAALSGWLYQTARLTAGNFTRTEIRRARREQEACMRSLSNQPEPEAWPQIMPLLEDAMGKLGEKDRNAIALRFFEGKSFQEVGAAFGATENAAKKRVGYALEKLRKYFSRHGVTSTSSVIAAALSANAIQAAPATLAKAATTVAFAKGTTASLSTLTLVKGALKIMAWTKAQTTITVGAIIILTAATTTVAVRKIEAHQRANAEHAALVSQTRYGNPSLKGSPFTTVHFDDVDSNLVTVAYDGLQYQLAAINGAPVAVILDFCRRHYGRGSRAEPMAEKRFSEDLTIVLSDMHHPANDDGTVNLTLVDLQTGRPQTIDRAPMTEENRKAIMEDRLLVNSNLMASLPRPK